MPIPAASPRNPSRRRRIALWTVGSLAAVSAAAAALIAWNVAALEAEIAGHAAAVEAVAAAARPAGPPAEALAALPPPVQRYFAFAFPDGIPPLRAVHMTMSGTFRRPGATDFAPMTAHQVASPAVPAFVFWGTTWVGPGLWAVAMDSYVDGRMRMIAKVLSTITVVDARGERALDDVSRMRFLLEGPLFPTALLPGPHLRWQAIDDTTARLAAMRDGREVGAYRVSFGPDGRILRYDLDAADGSANGRYHGAGDVAVRGDYANVDGVMLPMSFSIARRLNGVEQPFWTGRIDSIRLTMR